MCSYFTMLLRLVRLYCVSYFKNKQKMMKEGDNKHVIFLYQRSTMTKTESFQVGYLVNEN
jgi:hypothetical protein